MKRKSVCENNIDGVCCKGDLDIFADDSELWKMRNEIIATALISGMPIVTGDGKFLQYGVKTIC